MRAKRRVRRSVVDVTGAAGSSAYDNHHNFMDFLHKTSCINSMGLILPWLVGGTTNGSIAIVVHSTNESRGFVGRPGG